MEEIDKYNKMMSDLKNNFSDYTEIDNRVEIIPKWTISDIVICINNNFVEYDPSKGPKEGLTLGEFYKILSIPNGQMVIIKNDFFQDVPYFNWRFDESTVLF